MSVYCRTAWPMRAGRVMAGLTLAWLLAGCGGGGGGGGGGSSSTPSNPTGLPTPFASGTVLPGQSARIYDPALPATQSPEVDVAPNAVPTSDTQGITITIAIDPSPPSTTGFTLNSPAVYDIEPAGTNFSATGSGVTLKLPYTSSGGAVFPLIYYYDTTTSQWQPVPNSSNDVQNNGYISIQTNLIARGRGTNGAGPTDYAVLTQNIGAPPATP